MMHETDTALDNAGKTTIRAGTGGLTESRTGMLVGVAVASGLGFLGGMLLGTKRGEARGLTLGRELGRAETASVMGRPRPWRRLWRRAAAA